MFDVFFKSQYSPSVNLKRFPSIGPPTFFQRGLPYIFLRGRGLVTHGYDNNTLTISSFTYFKTSGTTRKPLYGRTILSLQTLDD